jgi:Domain of unknown function (DUF5615)
VALDLFLDNCANSDLLADLLRQAGHHVVRAHEMGMTRTPDRFVLDYAASNRLTVVTKNPADFQALHDHGNPHYGILGVHQDNDPSRDMSDREIAKAIANVENAATSGGDQIPGNFFDLNQWRY